MWQAQCAPELGGAKGWGEVEDSSKTQIPKDDKKLQAQGLEDCNTLSTINQNAQLEGM